MRNKKEETWENKRIIEEEGENGFGNNRKKREWFVRKRGI